jgi:hypothetical protein
MTRGPMQQLKQQMKMLREEWRRKPVAYRDLFAKKVFV